MVECAMRFSLAEKGAKMANTFLGQLVDIGDEVVYLKNLRTGSSTIRKCK